MKKICLYSILLFSISLFVVSCAPDDDDDDVVPGEITGTWRSQENSETYGPSNYYVDISNDSASSAGIMIDNFFNLGLGKKMKASQSGNTITLSSGVLEGFQFTGTGNVATNYKTITWSYSFDDGNGPEQVTGTYTKL